MSCGPRRIGGEAALLAAFPQVGGRLERSVKPPAEPAPSFEPLDLPPPAETALDLRASRCRVEGSERIAVRLAVSGPVRAAAAGLGEYAVKSRPARAWRSTVALAKNLVHHLCPLGERRPDLMAIYQLRSGGPVVPGQKSNVFCGYTVGGLGGPAFSGQLN